MVGKAIPATDATYLYGLQEQIEERYPKAHEEYLNLETPVRAVVDLSKNNIILQQEIEDLKQKVAELEHKLMLTNKMLDKTMEWLVKEGDKRAVAEGKVKLSAN